jgi:hypothetical protein
MATSQSQATQQEIDRLNDSLNDTLQKIADIGNNIDKGIRNQLINVTEKTREFANNLSKSKDISKDIQKINTELTKLNTKNIQLSINKGIAEKAIEEAAKKYNQQKTIANARALITAKQDLARLSNALKLNEAAEDQLRTLIDIAQKEKEQEKNLTSINKVLDKIGIGSILSFKAILDGVFKVDNQITQMSRSLGISKDAAGKLRDSMASYAIASKDSFINVERLAKAQEGLTEQLGIAVDFGNEERETFARLTEITGLSADEAGKLATFSAATGKSTRAYVSDLRVASMESSRANKIHISDKELLSSVAKLSAGILVKFQGNPKALAAAVVEAKKLGANLETVNKIGDSLLDWESSIENELEAELITGKKINLERAREAALTGNQLDLTREIADQVGTLSDYQEMNVIAQTSLAKAFGLNRDEMSEMLMKQEAINKYGEKASELNAEQLAYMEKHGMSAEQMLEKVENQRSTQEKFNDLMTKFQEIIANIAAGPLGTMLKLITDILESSKGISLVFSALGLYLAGSVFTSLAKIGKMLKAQKKDSMGAAIISIVKGAWESLGPIPFIGAALAVGAIAGGVGYLYSQANKEKGDDVISQGYGQRMLLDKGSITAFNDQDTIIAGTNLGGGRKNTGGGGGGGDSSALIAAIDSLHSTMKTKSNDIYMDSQKVGTQVGRQTSTGTQQSINSYKLA